MADEQRVVCPLCGRANFAAPALGYSQPPWRLKRCGVCGMVYLENPPTYQQLEDAFAWEKTFQAETARRTLRNPWLHKLGRLPKALVQSLFRRNKLLGLAHRYFQPGSIVDVGCAGGHTLAEFPPAFIPYGIEISHELSEIASAKFAPRGGRVIQSDALTGLRQLARGAFSGVIMTSFLEHEVNPRATLLTAKRVLRHGGRLILKVPNFASWNRHLRRGGWCGFRFPDHVNYFTPALLERLLHETGYRILRFRWTDRLPTSDTMWLVAEVAEG